MAAIKQVHAHNVENHTRHAITQRLGIGVPEAVISVAPDCTHTGWVILHVNSGGNAHAAECALRQRGYRVEPTSYDPFRPGNYGVQLRVGPTARQDNDD
ncbi:hypothetical protein BKG82_28425 [Mycobacteroides chelonae]|uniref:Uncharacterized protein n=1 Tax=Mycobacteroides chelonae TaxID=1774 RepID=A0A1S1LI59_MYCCH|nr:hypothetical protein [Mycobacteroides chelonae]OHU46109.1 hypothetical protein BKG82_28425 [Mycobacteroides chelonae]